MTDERFDQLIRNSLEWHATRAVAKQPTLRQATRNLAQRMGPRSTTIPPRVTLAPATVGGINLLIVLLLLLGVAVAVAVGAALLLSDSRETRPGPFGFGGFCGAPLADGYVLSFGTQGGGYRQLHASGSLHSDPSIVEHSNGSALTGREYVESTSYLERRLTPRGVELLRQKVDSLDLSAGCARLQTREQSGSVYARTDDGVVGLAWSGGDSPFAYSAVRRATEQEEERLRDLSADFADLQTWLPADAWVDPVERSVQPSRWLVYLTVTDRNRNSPAYERVLLPNGVEPATFGDELSVDPFDLDGAVTSRCGVVERSDALALADSMDSMSRPGWIRIASAFPTGLGCERLPETLASQYMPDPTPFVEGEFANLDPCTWVSEAAADAISVAPPELFNRRWLSPIGTWDPSCEIRDSTVMGTRATVSVHSRRMDLGEATLTAKDLLGGTTEEDVIADRPIWINSCLVGEFSCWWSIAAFSDPYLVVIRVDGRNQLTREEARAFVEAVLESI